MLILTPAAACAFLSVEASAMLSATAAASRVLITPLASPAVPSSPLPIINEDKPCSNIYTDDEASELPTCTCYPNLPAACTSLLESLGGEDLPDCGARIGDIILPPDSCQGGYYGHDDTLKPESVLERGLPQRGTDWDLVRHAEQLGNSACAEHDSNAAVVDRSTPRQVMKSNHA